MMKTGERIHALRRDLGISQGEMAARLGVTQAAMCKLEKGRMRPSAGTLQKLKSEFDCLPEWILYGRFPVFVSELKKIERSDMASAVGARLRLVRNAAQVSQTAMARALGIASASLCGFEKGESLPAAPTLKKIAELGVSVDWLFTGHGWPIRPDAQKTTKEEVEMMADLVENVFFPQPESFLDSWLEKQEVKN